jgi:hypothetical protein
MELPDGDIPLQAARNIIQNRFTLSIEARVNELVRKAQEGVLTQDERDELGEYERVGGALETLQSKSREVLRQAGESP